jgi:hypothetical protein
MGGHEFRYATAAELGSWQHVMRVTYTDDQGNVFFYGIDPGHESGGMLYFPTPDEWLKMVPERMGQRPEIFRRLLAYVRRNPNLEGLVPSLTEPTFFAQWPDQKYLCRKHWLRLGNHSEPSDPHPWNAAAPRPRKERVAERPFERTLLRYRMLYWLLLGVVPAIVLKACA